MTSAEGMFENRVIDHGEAAWEQQAEPRYTWRDYARASDLLLDRLHALFRRDPGDGAALLSLATRVWRLAESGCPDPAFDARLQFAAAWLSEIRARADSDLGNWSDRCVEMYSRYINHDHAAEPLLSVAFNNRGVLLISVGHPQGIRDLFRAAFGVNGDVATPPGQEARETEDLPRESGPDAKSPPEKLEPQAPKHSGDERARGSRVHRFGPGCFNLLSLCEASLESPRLREAVDTVLADVMPRIADEDLAGIFGRGRRRPSGDHVGILPPRQILSSSDELTTNLFLADLARSANINIPKQFRSEKPKEAENWADKVGQEQLQLWPLGLRRGVLNQTLGADLTPYSEACVYEAASLLDGSEVPSDFGSVTPECRAEEERIRRHLRRASEDAIGGRFVLALEGLEAIENLLRMTPVTNSQRFESEIRQIRSRAEAARRDALHAELRAAENAASKAVERYETAVGADVESARQQAEVALGRLQDAAGAVHPGTGRAEVGVLNERIRARGRAVDGVRIRARLKHELERLEEILASSWSEQASAEAHAALRQIELIDPEVVVGGAGSWEPQLDAWDARGMVEAAVDMVAGHGRGGGDRPNHDVSDRATEMLNSAIACDPTIAPLTAPLFCYLALPKGGATTRSLKGLAGLIVEDCRALLQTPEPAPGVSVYPLVRRDAVSAVMRSVSKALAVSASEHGSLLEVIRDLAAVMKPVALGNSLTAIEQVEELMRECLRECPRIAGRALSSWDARNPLDSLRRLCRVSLAIGNAEDQLDGLGVVLASPDRRRAAAERACSDFLAAAQSLGIWFDEAAASDQDDDALARELAGRVTTGVYHAAKLAAGQHPKHADADALERWAKELSRDELRRFGKAMLASRAELGRLLDVYWDGPAESGNADPSCERAEGDDDEE